MQGQAKGPDRLIGVDNLGRVVVSIDPGSFGSEELQDIFWLPPGGALWNYVGISTVSGNLFSSISKSGWILSTRFGGHQEYVACYLDLTNSTSGFRDIPPLPLPGYVPKSGQGMIPRDASAGRVVGGSWGVFDYDAQTGNIDAPELDPGWFSTDANGINAQGLVMGHGVKNYGTADPKGRGYVLQYRARRWTWPGLYRKFASAWILIAGAILLLIPSGLVSCIKAGDG